ncbi:MULTISPECIES: UvrD-helicase domain-containing protein [unclassified Adlercreutzia]|uniref:HelD family protein n=1 Tax=unclassified Adlercreutzia TaxID=2636013 RepID=UPI0013ED8F18|nr:MULTISPECIES: UvrD-helicase domain-containing protein [unclassified Adlercreutzia]
MPEEMREGAEVTGECERAGADAPISDDVGSASPAPDDASDPVFAAEQAHLTSTYDALVRMARELVAKMERTGEQAAADKLSMSEELAPNFATYADAMETYADFAAMNRVIDAYNVAQGLDAERLSSIRLLLRQPYFAKVELQYKPDAAPRAFYIGTAGISDDNCRRMVVDWRSPVAEVYYNQDNGPTSYVANGRTINVDLKLRRQFDIAGSRLNACFDTTVAIQDALLLASLSQQRSAQMRAITATIQREQNQVVRHADVPALLVGGIAGSGKTSVLMQRIAYLLYQNRETLDAREVFLVTPNALFRRYIENVLPDLGERNPEILTWDEFAASLLPPDRGTAKTPVPPELLDRIDAALEGFAFEPDDFRDVRDGGVRFLSAAQIRQVFGKFAKATAGPHQVTLVREELLRRVESKLAQMAVREEAQDEVAALPLDEQLRLFGEVADPQDEREAASFALRYLRERHAGVLAAVENDEWLRVDRIGMRLLGTTDLAPVTWLYLKIALTGLGNAQAKYVMIDEVQDYTVAQLRVLARYFRRAHFLLLGDENQAIAEGTATFDEVRKVFAQAAGAGAGVAAGAGAAAGGGMGAGSAAADGTLAGDGAPVRVGAGVCAAAAGDGAGARAGAGVAAAGDDAPAGVAVCQLMTSYRSTPEITALFAGLIPEGDRVRVASVQREDAAPEVVTCADEAAWEEALGRAVAQAGADVRERGGLAAVIAPHKGEAKKLAKLLGANVGKAAGEATLALIGKGDALPESGVVLIPLQLAKGLEFDHVIISDASERAFPAGGGRLARNRLYTTISRATRRITLLSKGDLTSLLPRQRA